MSDQHQHPAGTVQAIATVSIGLFALLIAFIGYTGFTGSAGDKPWRLVPDAIYLLFALFAVCSCLVAPWWATKAGTADQQIKSLDRARGWLAFAAINTLLSVGLFLAIDVGRNHF